MKKHWTTPTLTIHGSVEDLTAGAASCGPGLVAKQPTGSDDISFKCILSADSEIN